LTLFGTTMGSPQEFEQLLRAVNAGQIRPVIDRVLPLADAGLAHQVMDQQEQFGKIILSIG
jgi:zinc-binding alcohol dehydrogenase/oxidoreductase